MQRERILITVKTYPTLSRKYGETVCTAGVRADGSWVRLYPVPFRRLDEKEQYKNLEFTQKNLHFYLGTTQEFHFRAPNPWVIIGLLPIPHQRQGQLF